MDKKSVFVRIGIAILCLWVLQISTQPVKADDQTAVCQEGLDIEIPSGKVDVLLDWCDKNGFTCFVGSCDDYVGELSVSYKKVRKWVRYDSLFGKTAYAGYGQLTFTTNNVEAENAILIINDVGEFEVKNISCSKGNPQICTGDIFGFPFNIEPDYHGGQLSVNDGNYIATATLVQVPPPIQTTLVNVE
jgi:hypothetical protein